MTEQKYEVWLRMKNRLIKKDIFIFVLLSLLTFFNSKAQSELPFLGNKTQMSYLAGLNQASTEHMSFQKMSSSVSKYRLSTNKLMTCENDSQKREEVIDSIIKTIDDNSNIKVGLDFNNRLIYAGRLFAKTGVNISPSITYFNRTGFYATVASLHYTNVDYNPNLSELDLKAGYRKEIMDDWFVDFRYTHYFTYYDTSADLRNYLSNDLEVNTYYNFFDVVSFAVDFDFFYGQTKATVFNFELSRDFDIYQFTKPSVFTITPAIAVDIGSEKILARYIDPLTDTIPASISNPALSNLNFWGLLDFDASVDFKYRLLHYEFKASPHVVFPFNENQLSPNASSQPLFYFTLSVKGIISASKR